MFRRQNKNICGYWDCNTRIPDDAFLCPDHDEKWVEGLIDRCPKCGRFKDIMYQLCSDCYFGRRVKPKKQPAAIPKPEQQYKIEYSEAWTDGYMMPDKRFIYILELADGAFYVGQTPDIYHQLAELREGKTSLTAGRKARLGYLELAADEKAAEFRVAELKRLVKSNPGQVEAMILEFHHQLREFRLEPEP